MKTFCSTIVLLLLTTICFAQTGGGTSTTTFGTTSCISTFPYLNDFEGGLGWSQSSGDDFDWYRLSGSTPSSGTTGQNTTVTINDSTYPGPQSGATGTGSNTGTVTMNDSFPPKPKSAILTSSCFDISNLSGAQVSFLYRVFGTGQLLELEASVDGTNWTAIWSSAASLGTTWNTAVIELRKYKGAQSLQLRLKGTVDINTATGATWQGEISVDNILLSSAAGTSTTGKRSALGTTDRLEIKAFPNPFQDQLSVAIPYVENETATILLLDINGRQVFFQTGIQTGGKINIQTEVVPGVYVLLVQTGTIQHKIKMIKTE